MQRQRLQRERRLNLLNFQNLGDDLDFYHTINPSPDFMKLLHESLNNSTDDLNVVDLEQEARPVSWTNPGTAASV